MKGKRRILYNDKKSKTFNPIRIFYLLVLLIVSIWIYFIYLSPNVMKLKNIASENEIPNKVVDNSVDPINKIENSAKVAVESTESTSSELASFGQITDKKRKKRIAFAITLTKDGFFQDGAAVLAYSIYKVSKNPDHEISLLAFIHPNVTLAPPLLTKMGFRVIVSPTPINTSAIRFEFLRTKIDKNGCCGAAELIKLNSYRLTTYDVVVHLDADTFLLNPIDELFEESHSLIYTTDPNMATHKGIDKMPVQGGFIVLKPSIEDFNKLIHILMNTEFSIGGGWNRSRIGWFWGGMTVQGVLPYYYNTPALCPAGRTKILDRCIYNTMADVPECLVQTLDQIKSAHFTICQKPWNCLKKWHANELCRQLHNQWFALRKEAEAFYNIPSDDNPCPKGGPEAYRRMQLSNAVFPAYADKFAKDSSVGFMPPLPGSGFEPGLYW